MQQLVDKMQEKEMYERFETKARELIYPDLRAGYKKHNKMLSTLTKALVAVHKMALEDEATLEQVHTMSMFDTKDVFLRNLASQPIPSHTCKAPFAVSSRSAEFGSGIQSWQYTEDACYDITRRLRARGDTHIKIEKKDADGNLQLVFDVSKAGEK